MSKLRFLLSPFVLYFRTLKRKGHQRLVIIPLLFLTIILISLIILQNELEKYYSSEGDYDYDYDHLYAPEPSIAEQSETLNMSVLKVKLLEAEAKWKAEPQFQKSTDKNSASRFDSSLPEIQKSEAKLVRDPFLPSFVCPLRVESVGKGGKNVCGFSQMRHLKKCIVYSFGIDNDVSFEWTILKRTNCTVRIYDRSPMRARPKRLVSAFPGRVSYSSREVSKYRNSVKNLMAENGDMYVDIFKMDIEGAEWAVMNFVLYDFPETLPFGQFLMEIYLNKFEGQELALLHALFHHLEIRGLRPYFRESNPIAPQLLTEYSFINAQLGMFPNHDHEYAT